MQELLPIIIGVSLGFVGGARPSRRAASVMASGAVIGGVLVAWLTGELAESIGFAFLDAAVALCALVLTVVARRVAQRRLETIRRG